MASNKSRPTVIIVTDADNTLWDTNAIYRKGQLELLKRIEQDTGLKAKTSHRLRFVRLVDQELARLNKYNLRYPPELLVHAIAKCLSGLSAREAALRAMTKRERVKGSLTIAENSKWFKDYLESKTPKLRPGVRFGLRKVKQIGLPLLVLTEGSREKCETLLKHYNLIKYVFKIIEGRKRVSMYHQIASDLRHISTRKVMIGDQVDRDILAAKRAGYITVYFPSEFQPSWLIREYEKNISDYRISSFGEVPSIVSMLAKRM